MKKLIRFSMNAIGTVAALATTASVAFAATAIPPIEPATGTDVVVIIQRIITWLFTLAGALAVAYLIYAGIQYITGGAKGAEAAKGSIINAIIGIAVIVLAYVIVGAVVAAVNGSSSSAGF